MRIDLPFVPVACPRPRITMRGKHAMAYYPKKYTEFKKNIADYISKHYPGIGYPEGSILKINFVFIMPRPKYLMRKKDTAARIPHIKKPDLDNLVKSVNDSLEGMIFPNDSMIHSIAAQKWIAAKEEEAHIELCIEVQNDY